MAGDDHKIVVEARSWKNTPFHHQGRLKGIGCDCLGLVIGSLINCGVVSRFKDDAGLNYGLSNFDKSDYAPDPNSENLKEILDQQFDAINKDEIIGGDILLFKIIKLPQHIGIVGNHVYSGLSLIHAYLPAGKVVEQTLSKSWLDRVIGAYRIPLECYIEGGI